MARETRSQARVETCEGPRPTVRGGHFFIVARGPSDAIRASERVSPAISIVKRWRFRSVSTYMSIAARVVPFSRAFRSFIKKRAALAKTIKVREDLSLAHLKTEAHS